MDIPELLEEPTILEGVTKAQDSIMPKLQVLKFEYHDTWKQDMSRYQFMVVKVGQPLNADVVSSMEYACELEQSGILKMLLMPHFGRSWPVEMYFKKLSVCFHGGYLWLNKPYEVMVDLILAITGLP